MGERERESMKDLKRDILKVSRKGRRGEERRGHTVRSRQMQKKMRRGGVGSHILKDGSQGELNTECWRGQKEDGDDGDTEQN